MEITNYIERWNFGAEFGVGYSPVVMAETIRVWEGPRFDTERGAEFCGEAMAARIRSSTPRSLINLARDAARDILANNKTPPARAGMSVCQLRLTANISGLLELAYIKASVEQGARVIRLFPEAMLTEPTRPTDGSAA